MKGSVGLCRFPRPWQESFPVSSHFRGLQVFPGLWLHHSPPCLSLHLAFSPSVSCSSLLSHIRTLVMVPRPHLGNLG